MSDYGLIAPTREIILDKDIQQQGFVDIQDAFTNSEREGILDIIVKTLNKYSIKIRKNEYYGAEFSIVGTEPIYLFNESPEDGSPVIVVPTPNLGRVQCIIIGVYYYTEDYPLAFTILILMDKNSEVK